MHDPVYALAQQREGRLRILAISTGKRLAAIPDIPTMAEQGIEMDLAGWWAAMVPQGTPRPIIEQINKWFVQVVSSDETKKFLNQFGGDQNIMPIDEAQALFLQEIKNWADYVKIAKIEPQG
jgi:tripartite-type tricarboxylate transporter receptor subunit TctC